MFTGLRFLRLGGRMRKKESSDDVSSIVEPFDFTRIKTIELLLESCLESPKDMIILAIDQNYRYLYFNKLHAQVMKFTYNADVKVGMDIFDAISSPVDRENSKKNYEQALKGISHSTIQAYGDTDIRIYESFYNPIIDKQNQIIGTTAFARDITDRIRAEEALRNKQILIDSILNQTTDVVYVKDKLGKYILVNRSATEYVGKHMNEIIGKTDYDIFSKTEADAMIEKDTIILKNPSVQTFEEHVTNYKNIEHVYLSTKGPLYDQADKLIGTFGISRNITERITFEQKLLESEARFKLLIDSSPDAMYIQMDNKFKFANKATIKLFGVEDESELIGQFIVDWIHPDYRDEVNNRMRELNVEQQGVPTLEEIFIRKDKSFVHVEVNAVPIYYEHQQGSIAFVRNIEERIKHEQEQKIWEAQLRQQQKLEAIGLLAGGVAHEINNPINIMMNYAQLILDEDQDNSNVTEYAHSIIQDCLRISDIVKNLLQFSRSEKVSFSLESMEEIINNTLLLINSVIKKDHIEIEVKLEEDLPLVLCHSQQIQQVLINLLTNARDALNEKFSSTMGNKRILIQATNIKHNNQKYLQLHVEDNGIGISDKNLQHLFEPFFSTKEKDQGTGLGLSISFGIIKNHKGTIRCETKEHEFTRFIIELPLDQ